MQPVAALERTYVTRLLFCKKGLTATADHAIICPFAMTASIRYPQRRTRAVAEAVWRAARILDMAVQIERDGSA
jgi:hypothetical protein